MMLATFSIDPAPIPAPAPFLAQADPARDAMRALTAQFLAHGREVPAYLAAVLKADPDHVVGWSLKAIFPILLARGELLAGARQAAARARRSLDQWGGDRREAGYVTAAEALAQGDWALAMASIESALDHDPADSLAAKISHALRFMLGDRQGMLASIERVISRTGLDHPDAGFLLGCKAFALEENGFYREAEFLGRSALERQPNDAWGMHAVSHTHEMTGRIQLGQRWIEERRDAFEHCNNFRYHLFWHLALFRLEDGDVSGVLDLYDSSIRADKTDDYRDIANAASLLQRLDLAGVDVGGRWGELADLCERRVADRSLVFADLHYLMALAGAGRRQAVDAFFDSQGEAASQHQARLAEAPGRAVAEGILAYREGRYAEATERLLAGRVQMQGLGGSHAQRDVFEQLLIESAVRAGHPAARTLLYQRLGARKGRNRFASLRLQRLSRGGATTTPESAVMYSEQA